MYPGHRKILKRPSHAITFLKDPLAEGKSDHLEAAANIKEEYSCVFVVSHALPPALLTAADTLGEGGPASHLTTAQATCPQTRAPNPPRPPAEGPEAFSSRKTKVKPEIRQSNSKPFTQSFYSVDYAAMKIKQHPEWTRCTQAFSLQQACAGHPPHPRFHACPMAFDRLKKNV